MEKLRLRSIEQTLFLMSLDALLICSADVLALLIRYDFSFQSIPQSILDAWYHFLPVQIILTILMFLALRMYRYVLRSVSAHEVFFIQGSALLASLVCLLIEPMMGARLPSSVNVMLLAIETILLVGVRCVARFYKDIFSHLQRIRRSSDERIMLIGAGNAGGVLIRELTSSKKAAGKLCCIIDDDAAKWGKYIDGAQIVGGRERIQKCVNEYSITQIIFAIPTASAATQREILEICNSTGCKVKRLPGVYQLLNGESGLSAVRDVQVEDLLGREPVRLDTDKLNGFIGGKTVMVTGGGGSIGSELCRQIMRFHPGQLIILDIYENNAYDIQQELLQTYGHALNLHVEIASVRDKEKVYELVDAYRPDIIFHAAAHKHVPLMEACPEEAIKNNVFGTYHVVRAAEKFGVKKFVMISTDKAVNPTNFMGATKRFCEMILQSRGGSTTDFCAVRFGNVLGSNGSVVPLFKKQIEAGGPVTITDKRVIRYFMTIPEAAQLVLEAGAMADRGDIFVLDMGEPVKILMLAESLIRLSGYEPYKDIDIKEIGLRPGEKLYEELLIANERLMRTGNNKIFVEHQHEISQDVIMADLKMLDEAICGGHTKDELITLMKELVPSYYAPEQINSKADTQDIELNGRQRVLTAIGKHAAVG